jgi:hypothetical protein
VLPGSGAAMCNNVQFCTLLSVRMFVQDGLCVTTLTVMQLGMASLNVSARSTLEAVGAQRMD